VSLLSNCWLLLITFAVPARVSILRLIASLHVSNWMKTAVQTVSYSEHCQAMWIWGTCFWVTNIQYLGTSEPFAATGNLNVIWENELSHIIKTKLYKKFFLFEYVFLHFMHRKGQYISVPFDPCLIFYNMYISLACPHELDAIGIHFWQDQGIFHFFGTSRPTLQPTFLIFSRHYMLFLSSNKDKNKWKYPPIPPAWLHGMDRDYFTLI
jgi:hypothetical protein